MDTLSDVGKTQRLDPRRDQELRSLGIHLAEIDRYGLMRHKHIVTIEPLRV